MNAQQLGDHFLNMLNPVQPPLSLQYAAPMYVDEVLDAPFSLPEVQQVIANAKKNKAPGDDRIPFEFYKNCTTEFMLALTSAFNRIFESEDIPGSFKKAIIFPIHKKGEYNDPANYRGISFLNTSAKLFSALLYSRLNQWVKSAKILHELQAGFRENYSTVDHIFTLFNIAEIYRNKQKKLYAVFVDFRAAFDSVDREALFYKLYRTGVSSKIINTLRALYENNIAYVWDGNGISEGFPTTTGVKQGCILSALLFILFINDITDNIGCGIEINGTRIPALMYADDIVFLAESVHSMQLMINRLETYCKTWNLSVNLEKTKIMIFRDGGGRYSRNETWTYQGVHIEVVREYKYLGVLITANLNMKKHLESKLSEAKRAVSSVWDRCIKNNLITHSSKQKIIRTAATSILLYGAQVWGYCSFAAVEKFLYYSLKRIFRLPSTTPNYMLHLETESTPLFLETLNMHFNYIVKVMDMRQERLPKIILEHIISTKGNCVQEWENLASNCAINLSISSGEQSSSLRRKFDNILKKTSQIMYDSYIEKAQSSQHRMYYSHLRYNLGDETYFLNSNSTDMISTIFKIRGELINLNYIPHRPELPIICDLCNLREREDVLHFIAACPILKEFRMMFFGTFTLGLDDAMGIMNGNRGWSVLYKYAVNALRYRRRIIEGDF